MSIIERLKLNEDDWLFGNTARTARLRIEQLEAENAELRLNSERWNYFANSAQTALMLGSNIDQQTDQDWLTECNKLADAAIKRKMK